MSEFIKEQLPKKLDDLHFNRNLISFFKNISFDNEIPHLLIHGPEMSGKKTIINAFLSEKYDINNIKEINELIKVNSSNTINVKYYLSENYFIINPSLYNLYDKVIVQILIKNIVKTKNVNNNLYKTIIILNSDNLTIEAQNSLRRTFEIYMNNCRFILIAKSITKIIKPLNSRTLKIRCKKPKLDDIKYLIEKIINKYNFNLTENEILEIIDKSKLNIETTLLLLELIIKFKKNIYEINLPEDNTYILVDKILNSEDINSFMKYKDVFYKMTINNINPTTIIKNIMNNLIKINTISNEKKYKIIKLSVYYEHKMSIGSKEFFYIETLLLELYSFLNTFTGNSS